MDFEFKNLEMIETNHQIENVSTPHIQLKSQSLILNELHKENDELQNKLKLNYRRLLLYEAENTKLSEEKNKLFFEAQNHLEKLNLISQRNEELENESESVELRTQQLNEKVYALQKINSSQLNEIKRFSKFHLKIQNVIKPYILQLKNKVLSLQKENTSANAELQLFKNLNEKLEQKNTDLFLQKEAADQIYQIDKNGLISSYEEQIHSFSKEILDLQNQVEIYLKEISRLKKSNEFKNYYENELIKFKRIHQEDQIKIQNTLDLNNYLETQNLKNEEDLAKTKNELQQVKLRFEEKENVLEVTRQQLAKQIDESVLMNERLCRLEKLNNQLSREMNPTT